MSWNHDMSKAPRGRYVIQNRKAGKGAADVRVFEPQPILAASKCGKVGKSWYLPDEKRWVGFTKDGGPIAWQPWPEHPYAGKSAEAA